MPTYDEQPILALGTTPIAGAAPAGADIADDEDYLLVQAEMAKLDRIDLGTPDWFQIESATQGLLQGKSKDVEMACALGYALFRKHRYAGLAATLGMFTGLITTFWDGLFPARPRRRKARMESLCEQLVEANWLRDAPPKPDEFDAIDLCMTRLDELEAALKEKMPDEEPDFGKFRRKMRDFQKERPKPVAPAAAPAATAQGDAPAAAPAAPAGGGGGFAAGELQDASGAINAVLAAASFLRKKDATEPLAYALPRAVKWARVGLPASAEARRDIPAPDKNLVEGLEFQFANGVWEHLLNNAESAFRVEDPLWLDLQRWVCAAMAGLGSQFAGARQAVMAATGALVQRLGSGIYDLAFKGGRGLCSGETRMWLEAEVLPAKGGGGAGASASNGKLTDATEEARKLAAGGKLAEAVGKLQAGLAECAQRRDRFLWKLHIAQLCFETQRLQLAAPLLEECAEEIQRYRIDEWEPGLAAQVAQTLYRCRKALVAAEKEPGPEVLARVRESYAWLCQLDPVAALAAEPAGR